MAKIQDIRNRTQRTNGTRKLSQIKYIVRHHSATKDGNFDSFWRHWKGTRGWGTGGYHEIILRDGTVQLCYDPHEITNGVKNMNTLCLNICLVGDGSFTAAQEKAWDERVAHYMKLLNIDVDNVKGHGELQKTTCPGINMDIVRNRIRRGVVVKPTKQEGIFWNGNKMAKGQVGRITILKPINLWKRVDVCNVEDCDYCKEKQPGLMLERILNVGESYRVYGYDGFYGGQYAVGGGFYITDMEGYIKYETPSKAKLESLREYYN